MRSARDHRPYRPPARPWRDCAMQPRHVTRHSAPVRVLVETDDPALAICDFGSFVDAGFSVVVCGGPADGHPCPALDGQPCPALDEADVVFNTFHDSGLRYAVANAVRAMAPDVGVVVSAPAEDAGLPDGCVFVSDVTSVPGQVAALRRAAFRAT